MSDKAIIEGALVDCRNLDTDKCVKLSVHVPAEYALSVVAAFGWPTRVNPVSVAIARLEEPKAEKPRRSWDQLSRAEQAGIACNDPDFCRYLAIEYTGAQDAAATVRQVCKVISRADIDIDPQAVKRWDKLYSDFQLWKRGAVA